MKYRVIEHRSRGVYVGFEIMRTSGEWMPRFRWSIPRSDGERFYNLDHARREMSKIEKAGVEKCYFVTLDKRWT